MTDKTSPVDDEKRELATKTAMFLAEKLNSIGIHTEIVSQAQAQEQLRQHADSSEFSVADIQKLNYEWNGDSISLKVFAQTFGELIKQKDRTMEDVDRIAKAYIQSVKADPSLFVPQLKAENMSHWRYFVLNDGSVYTPEHIMANSPEYSTQMGLWEIYRQVLGNRMSAFVDMMRRRDTMDTAERENFLEMEREVSASVLMQSTLETNAAKVNERRNLDVVNLIQYFENNDDYTYAEKALILKGSMTYSYSEKKKDQGRNEVKLVRITDANDVAIPVLGGEAASIAEGLRKGLNFKDSLILARNTMDDSQQRSVGRDFTGWKLYPKSNREEDAVILNKDAAGTGWCTGGAISTARTHLSGGDFHIYFEDGEPLIAIRTMKGWLAEAPRGAHPGQFCTMREEDIAFRYIQEGHGIVGGKDYINDMLDLRTLNDPSATWKDVIKIPPQRRYENGEYGDDTQSWGKAATKRLEQIMADSRSERLAAGYYTPQEIAEYNIPHKNVAGLLNDKPFTLDSSWVNLQFIKGDIKIPNDTIVELPVCTSVGGRVNAEDDATIKLPVCTSVGEYVVAGENATIDLPACTSVGEYVTACENASIDLPVCTSVNGGVIARRNASIELPVCTSVGGGVRTRENATIELPVCTSVGGNIEASENATIDLPACTSVGGSVETYENATIELPACTSVGRDIEVARKSTIKLPVCASVNGGVLACENASIDLPACTGVGGYVQADQDATIKLPVCTSVGRRVETYENATIDLPACTSVGGRVETHSDAIIELPACTSVGEWLVAYVNATIKLPVCTSVGGYVTAYKNASIELPACTSVGGSVEASYEATIKLPVCTSVGGYIEASYDATIELPNKHNYHLSDGVVYGYEYNDTIYLTPEGINPNTPIHEYAHLWAKAMQATNPDLWNSIKRTLKETNIWEIIAASKDYSFLDGNEDRLAGEVLATMVGDNAENLLIETASEVLKKPGNEREHILAVADSLKKKLEEHVAQDLFELSESEIHLNTETLTLSVLYSLVEQKNILNGLRRVEKNKEYDLTAKTNTPMKKIPPLTVLAGVEIYRQKLAFEKNLAAYDALPRFRKAFTVKPRDPWPDMSLDWCRYRTNAALMQWIPELNNFVASTIRPDKFKLECFLDGENLDRLSFQVKEKNNIPDVPQDFVKIYRETWELDSKSGLIIPFEPNAQPTDNRPLLNANRGVGDRFAHGLNELMSEAYDIFIDSCNSLLPMLKKNDVFISSRELLQYSARLDNIVNDFETQSLADEQYGGLDCEVHCIADYKHATIIMRSILEHCRRDLTANTPAIRKDFAHVFVAAKLYEKEGLARDIAKSIPKRLSMDACISRALIIGRNLEEEKNFYAVSWNIGKLAALNGYSMAVVVHFLKDRGEEIEAHVKKMIQAGYDSMLENYADGFKKDARSMTEFKEDISEYAEPWKTQMDEHYRNELDAAVKDALTAGKESLEETSMTLFDLTVTLERNGVPFADIESSVKRVAGEIHPDYELVKIISEDLPGCRLAYDAYMASECQRLDDAIAVYENTYDLEQIPPARFFSLGGGAQVNFSHDGSRYVARMVEDKLFVKCVNLPFPDNMAHTFDPATETTEFLNHGNDNHVQKITHRH